MAKNEIKTSSSLDFELTKAAHDLAEHHIIHAAELWARHIPQNVAADLDAAINTTEKSAEWSGEKMSARGEKVIADSKKLSQKLVAGEKWTGDEVGKGIASLGTEINHLGKKMETSAKTTK